MSSIIKSLSEYEVDQRHEFISRHIGPTANEQNEMLSALGYSSLNEFINDAVPDNIRTKEPIELAGPATEQDVLLSIQKIAQKNESYKTFIGTGYYGSYTPSVIQRNILENPAWYTSYTPYQPEISQGRLEALLNFQTMIIDLTGMELANASLLDEATAAAEAMTMCKNHSKKRNRNVFFVSDDCHPQTIDVIKGRAEPLGIDVIVDNPFTSKEIESSFSILIQYPGTYGHINDYRELIKKAKMNDIMIVMSADPLALTILTPPGELGADIAIGSTQRFGLPMFFGGPHAAYIATHNQYKRELPGRLVGVSYDVHGNIAYRLALQSREQHIRREGATSNICTAQALLAIVASMYAVYHGPAGLKNIAERIHRMTFMLEQGLRYLGWRTVNNTYFDTITIYTGENTEIISNLAIKKNINLRIIDNERIGISLDETSQRQDIIDILEIFADGCELPDLEDIDKNRHSRIPDNLIRTTSYLQHEVFNKYHSETELLRYIRSLSDKDLALDRTMIPLGSCTMKLNATTELIPISFKNFTDIHPFAPASQYKGYSQLISDLEQMLCTVTGYKHVSLQPNSGALGEYAGLLAIRRYQSDHGEGHRNICLIPSSAHGTNPASAKMAGLNVVVVECDQDGNVDINDLRYKAENNSNNLSALMITYPSTHGVFEESVREICNIIHQHGGQVYIDGANLNATIGLCNLHEIGGDVSHLNLHKTFCIPHGGGGPGIGPIAVAEHLTPYLPSHRVIKNKQLNQFNYPVAAAPWGSAGILPITWAYIRLMGKTGIENATKIAILNANYIAKRLEEHYPILYKGKNGFVAHECIIDLRPLKKETGISVDDIAKRLIDYGFHAPTMSFPVPGTFMIEPTESESKDELDRFCEAMISIRNEINKVKTSEYASNDNPLINAPHTNLDLIVSWDRSYSRSTAVFPVKSFYNGKYWPPVGRINNAYGDRHLVCTCPPISSYREQAEDDQQFIDSAVNE